MRATAGRRGAKGLSQRRPFGRRHSAVSDLRKALARRYDARGKPKQSATWRDFLRAAGEPLAAR